MTYNVTETLENLRIRYSHSALDVTDCAENPSDQMGKWIQEAINGQCDEPNAFTLSTCAQGKPHARILLLKGLQAGNLYFYTNYKSAKGIELTENSHVAMTFLWLPLQRQVRVEGKVVFSTEGESDEYFQKRPRGSQLGAIASPQSSRVKDRSELEKMFKEVELKYKDVEVLPRPKHWGGYVVIPEYFEFWQGRDNRMHDRIGYEKKGASWERFRLAP